MKFRILFLLVLSQILFTNFLFASEDEVSKLSLEDLLNVTVETGSFLEVDFTQSPLSLTVIDATDIELASSTKLSELLEIYVPGFYTLYNKWVGEIWALRGVSSDINNKFIILFNGRKMNVESRDGTIALMYAYIGEEVERIEVLRGPAGLVYGSGAMAGVINIVTNQNTDGKDIWAHINHGMYDIDNATDTEKVIHNKYQIVPTTFPKKDGHTEFRVLTNADVAEIANYLANIA